MGKVNASSLRVSDHNETVVSILEDYGVTVSILPPDKVTPPIKSVLRVAA
jgi:hypothetical protein